MEKKFTGSETIGDIVTVFPTSANLFKVNRIDFCCGGNRVLREVLQQKKIDEQAFIQELNVQYTKAIERGLDQHTNWQDEPISGLIDHVVNVHHAYLRKELPLLSEFVTKIFRVHGSGHPELGKLYRIFHHMKTELEQHLIVEEEVLFPLIKEAEADPSVSRLEKAIEQLNEAEGEHDVVGDDLKEMRSVTKEYLLPDDACRTYTLTFQKLEELESDVFEHVHLENNILFPRIVQMKQQLQ